MTALILTILATALILALPVRGTLFSGDQARRMRWRTRVSLRPGPGFATLPELILRWGRLPAALSHGGRARPSTTRLQRLTAPPTQYARYLGRGPYHRRCWAPLEEQALILSGPRRGKSGLLQDWTIDHPGPAIIIGYPDLWDATAGYRARHERPVDVINPEHAGGIPTTFGWDITSGCQDPAEAIRRATDLVGAVAEGDMAWWVEKAAAALSGGMHAAGVIANTPPAAQPAAQAMIGVAAELNAAASTDMGAVWAWANGTGDHLIQRAAPHASEQLLVALAELQRTGKAADSIRLTMTKSLTWLAIPEIAAMVTGPAARPFDVPDLIASHGTIYMIAPDGDDAPAAPLYRCFASYIHREARRHALTQPRRKLDPGLFLGIDELHLAPLPLPRLLADSAGHGIQIAAVLHSIGQLEDKYGPHGARTVWQTAGTKIFLPGIHDTDTLDTITKLAGDHYPKDSAHPRPKAPAEFIRRLPRWRALIICADLSPIVVKFRPSWRRPAFRLHRNPPPPALAATAPPSTRTVTPAPAPQPALTPGLPDDFLT